MNSPQTIPMLSFLRSNQRAQVCTIVKTVHEKTTGYDDQFSKPLKHGAVPLFGAICQLVNMSVSKWAFPDVLKHVNVVPLLLICYFKNIIIQLFKKSLKRSSV